MEILKIGFFFENLLGNFSENFFDTFLQEHKIQELKESNKPDISYRKGIYMSEMKRDDTGVIYHLLRCSTNLNGPTECFTDSDRKIINIVNEAAKKAYPDCSELNHVLAQVYYNHSVNNRQRRAKIPAHSDKTEDMPENGLIAFCTFYDSEILKNKKYRVVDNDIFYKNTSALTRLRFIDKETKEKTDITLTPNSVFIIDLKTNERYTHEIVPPNLDSKDIPTRLGYVIRCSKQKAKFTGKTYIENFDGKYVPLREPTEEDIIKLKNLYILENTNTVRPNYDFIDFSLNKGDYINPLDK